jgi:hypothetical protein
VGTDKRGDHLLVIRVNDDGGFCTDVWHSVAFHFQAFRDSHAPIYITLAEWTFDGRLANRYELRNR